MKDEDMMAAALPKGSRSEIGGVMLVTEDVTSRVDAERKLLSDKQELEAQVALRTAELATARELAERASEAKSQFLAAMSHELRTPLNAILGFGQLLELGDGLDETQRTAVGDIIDAARHLLLLINQILDLSRIEVGELTLQLEAVPAAAIVHSSMKLMQPTADEQSIVLRCVGDPPDVRVWADPTRAKQVLLNLLNNAIKYNKPGGSVQLDCRVTDERMLRVEVSDTGVGIPTELHHAVFQRFNRLRGNTGIEGLGIGLSISKELVQLMNGRMGFRSEVGKGCCFWFELPVHEQSRLREPSPEPRESAGADRRHRDAKILCIEDNPTNLRLTAKLVERLFGVRMLEATNAEDGLTICSNDPPDLVLMDVGLPNQSGIDAVKLLRANPKTAALPIVVLSGYATREDVEDALQAGANAHLAKPLDVRAFARVLSELLDAGSSARRMVGQGPQAGQSSLEGRDPRA